MNTRKQAEMPGELLGQLFSWPEGEPLAKPRFGKVSSEMSARLPKSVVAEACQGAPPPFRPTWESDHLGLKVIVEEAVGDEAGNLFVTVLCRNAEYLGKEVKVMLIGRSGDKDECHLLVTVALDAAQRDAMNSNVHDPIGCTGRTRLGTPSDLRNRLGDGDVSLDAFLLV